MSEPIIVGEDEVGREHKIPYWPEPDVCEVLGIKFKLVPCAGQFLYVYTEGTQTPYLHKDGDLRASAAVATAEGHSLGGWFDTIDDVAAAIQLFVEKRTGGAR